MKVVGFTFIRNAIKYEYPIVEAIRSILPLCDQVIVSVGNSEDGTRDLIKGIDPDKIVINETIWDDSLRDGGRVLALETDKSYQLIPEDTDWAFYIQGDEVVHEKYYDNIKAAMEQYKDDPMVEGLLFKYRHFYGSYDYVGDSPRWYRREIRIVKYNKDVFSYKDAQGFRKRPNDKLKVKLIDAYVHHYGWVKSPDAMQRKQHAFHKLWHDDQWMEENIGKAEEFDYSGIDSLKLYQGTHPKVMSDFLNKNNWKFDYDLSKNNLRLKDKIKKTIERITGYRIGEYKNYKLLR